MKKKWIVVLAVVAVIAVAVVLFFAVTGQRNLIWAEASFTDTLTFYTCDGKVTWHGNLYDPEKTETFVKMLSGINVKKAKDWSPDKATYPMYAISIGTWKDGMIKALWTNGYLLLDDGSVYRCSYDFSTVRENREWAAESTREQLRYLPNMRALAQTEEGWNTKFMVPAWVEVTGVEGVAMELVGISENKVKVKLTNHGDGDWHFGEGYTVDALVDGVWYGIPVPLGRGLDPVPAIAWGIHPGAVIERSYSLESYGELPPGTYRLIVEGMSVEFALPAE